MDLVRNSVAVARRRGHDEKLHVGVAVVAHLVGDAGRDLETGSRGEPVTEPVHVHGELTSEHEKELSRSCVAVPLLLRGWRHAFLDDAELWIAHEMPSVARIAPVVMLGGGAGDGSGGGHDGLEGNREQFTAVDTLGTIP